MTVRVAVVQTRYHEGPENRWKNVERALSYLDEAAHLGAHVVCLPETYPGAIREPIDFDPYHVIAQKAKERGIYVIYGTGERTDSDPTRHWIVEVLIGPDGNTVGKYRRTSPPGPWIYKGGRFWDLNYKEADELPVFNTDFGKVGILICSEVYLPELSRILALKGAEIVFMPAGIDKAQLWNTWRLLIHARAIENLMYTATCQNLLGAEDGLAMIASPEAVILESVNEGVFVADLDLERIRWLRETTDRYSLPMPFKTKPGVLSQWRRLELYGFLTRYR